MSNITDDLKVLGENLERLIQESLDDLPDLYRTSGGQ